MPETSPPSGVVSAVRTPCEREVPMWRLSAFTPSAAVMFGLKSPTSRTSFDMSTAPISEMPTVEYASMRPG